MLLTKPLGSRVVATCEVCGNDDDKSFEVVAAGERHVFDGFESAAHRVAPVCEHRGCKVIGHGHEAPGRSVAVRTAHGRRKDTDAVADRV